MSEPFLGCISIFGFNFPPRGWAQCSGQTLPINQNQSLFSLLGTTYGGDGRTTFALPDMRGRAPMHAGNGAGLSSRTLGQQLGTETVTLSAAQIPPHSHSAIASTADSTASTPQGNLAAPTVAAFNVYGDAANLTPGAAGQVGPTGGQGHQNMQPYTTLNFCIALQGLFPSRN
jgi:microcystin-dependent protein